MKKLQELLVQIGLEPERVQMFNISSAMAAEFARAAAEMNEKIERLGPNPLREVKDGDS